MSAKVVRLHHSASDRVSFVRARAHMTQREFASFIGVSASTVSAWERGRSHPSRLARLRLADYEHGLLTRPTVITWVWK